jgi:hypothetical protein
VSPIGIRRGGRRSAAYVAVSALLVTVAGCGGDEDASEPGAVISDPGVSHIHGLGINPADDSLVIATHTGLFRAAPGERKPKRVGDRRQDTMGFTVVGPDRFIGSGHPDARDDLPPLLGLIRSDDAGRSWDSVSLLGDVDFHVLRAAGSTIYGVNATDGKLFVSDDGGRRWAARVPPGDVVDVAPRPGRPGELVASIVDGLHVSRDAGATWRHLDPKRIGLLAWPAADALFLIDAGGAVHRSADGGRSWRRVGSAGGQPAALAARGDHLYVALHTNEVKTSADGGRTWQLRATG